MSTPATPSQTAGPLFGFALIFDGCENAVAPDAEDAIRVQGVVRQADDEPFATECFLELWSGDIWVRTRTDPKGRFSVVVRKPEGGETRDGQPLAPHLNVTLFGRGLLKQLQTRLYFPDEPQANNRDPILRVVPEARRHTLIAQPTDAGLRFDINLRGDDETVFFGVGAP